MNRREFLKTGAAAAVATVVPVKLLADIKNGSTITFNQDGDPFEEIAELRYKAWWEPNKELPRKVWFDVKQMNDDWKL